MKLTKYKHACFTIEMDGKTLVVDPGELSPDFVANNPIVAVIITHAHPDHFSLNLITDIRQKNPDVKIFSTAEVTQAIGDPSAQTIRPGEHIDIEPFHVDIYGGAHAAIHDSVPAIDNIAVMINNKIYYPGDSFVRPDAPVDTLAVPLGAPWLKIAEAIDFLVAVNPRFAFPTHDETLSTDGKGFSNVWMQRFASENGITYTDISGKTIEVE